MNKNVEVFIIFDRNFPEYFKIVCSSDSNKYIKSWNDKFPQPAAEIVTAATVHNERQTKANVIKILKEEFDAEDIRGWFDIKYLDPAVLIFKALEQFNEKKQR